MRESAHITMKDTVNATESELMLTETENTAAALAVTALKKSVTAIIVRAITVREKMSELNVLQPSVFTMKTVNVLQIA